MRRKPTKVVTHFPLLNLSLRLGPESFAYSNTRTNQGQLQIFQENFNYEAFTCGVSALKWDLSPSFSSESTLLPLPPFYAAENSHYFQQ